MKAPVNRREFITASAALAAGLSLAPVVGRAGAGTRRGDAADGPCRSRPRR